MSIIKKLFLSALTGAFLWLWLAPPTWAAMSLTFSNLPTSVNEDDEFTVEVSLIDAPKETVYYLRAALYEAGKTNYFGYTYNHLNQWHNAPSEATKFLEITTNAEGSWSGKLKAKADLESSFFKGEGEYQFKVGRYTTSGNFGSWSDNSGTITIVYTPPPSPSPTPSPNPSPSPSPTTSPSPTPKSTPKPSPTKLPSPTPEASPESLTLETTTDSGEVLGSTQAAESKKKNPYWLAIILISLGLGLLGSVAVAAVRAARYNQTNDQNGKT